MAKINEHTEGKFSGWCKSKGYYRLKLQVNIDTGMIGFMKARAMISDFLVLSDKNTYFVEVKEVLKDDSFPNSRFRQQFKLTKMSNVFPDSHIRCFILIHFVKHKKVVLLEINKYNELLKIKNSKSLKLSDIPDNNLFTWQTLKL